MMGARLCIENSTNRPIVVQLEHISVRYCSWVKPGRHIRFRNIDQGVYTLRAIDPTSLDYVAPNMTKENIKAIIGGLLIGAGGVGLIASTCLLYTSPSPRDATLSRMPSSA